MSSSQRNNGNAFDGDAMPLMFVQHEEATCCQRLSRFASARFTFGIFLLLITVFLWVGASHWIQFVYIRYDKPFFLTYIATSFFSLYGVGFIFVPRWRLLPLRLPLSSAVSVAVEPESEGVVNSLDKGASGASTMEVSCVSSSPFAQVGETLNVSEDESDGRTDGGYGAPSAPTVGESLEAETLEMYSLNYVARSAALFCPFFILANMSFNFSLAWTSVASTTILSSTSCIWILLMARYFLNQPITLLKTVAVLCTVGGTVMISCGDRGRSYSLNVTQQEQSVNCNFEDHGPSSFFDQVFSVTCNRSENGTAKGKSLTYSKATTADPENLSFSRFHLFVGNGLSLLSAFFYAAYTTFLSVRFQDERRYYMSMVFAFVGIINLLTMWPLIALFHWIGLERWEAPSLAVWLTLAVNAVLGTNLSELLWAKSVILTSPLVATLGLSLTIPLAMVSDIVLDGSHYSMLYVVGATTVTMGFILCSTRR